MNDDDSLPLDARAIESHVSKLWQQATDSAAGGLVRASTLTLLVLLVDQSLSPRVDSILEQAPATHPCRIIQVIVQETEPQALLSAFCRPPSPGRPPVCWEVVKLLGSRSSLRRVMSAARALVIPNLPVQVWWPGSADLTSPLFQQIVEVGDRIIVDSAQFTSPLSTLAHYADQAEAEHGTVGFVDLNWRRLEPWRLVLAQFFDAVEERRFLSYVETLTISYRQPLYGSAGGLAAALLLLGWFASRLGWSAPDRPLARGQDLQILEFDDGGRDVRVELRRVDALEADSSLTAVEIHCRFDQRTARYLVERSDDETRSIVEREDVRRETQVHLALADEAKLLAEELTGFGRDRIYEDALQVIRVLDRGAPTTMGTL